MLRNTVAIIYALIQIFSYIDPNFQGPIPNLDGCEGHSEHILFGTNVDITESDEVGQTDHVTTEEEMVV